MGSARLFVETRYRHELRHHRGDFYAWNGAHYVEVPDGEIRAEIYSFLDSASTLNKKGKPEPFRPTTARVTEALDALRAVTIAPGRNDAPFWLDERAAQPDVAVLRAPCGRFRL
jgi:hypothetical protein